MCRQSVLPSLSAVLTLSLLAGQAAADREPVIARVLPPHDAKPGAQRAATLIVEDCLDPECRTTANARRVPFRWDEPLTLQAPGPAMRISAEDGVWVAPLKASAGEAVALRSWPMAAADVDLEWDRGESAPSTVLLRISGDDVPAAEVRCRQMNTRRWSCPVPVARTDLRLQAGDFIPH
jgi:hypothetical protein